MQGVKPLNAFLNKNHSSFEDQLSGLSALHGGRGARESGRAPGVRGSGVHLWKGRGLLEVGIGGQCWGSWSSCHRGESAGREQPQPGPRLPQPCRGF